jgi:hypothetical protein
MSNERQISEWTLGGKIPILLLNYLVGLSILVGYVLVVEVGQQNSWIRLGRERGKRISVIQNAVTVCSSLNILSHTAVVAQMLNEAHIINILLGVSFDMFSQILYACMWISTLTTTQSEIQTDEAKSKWKWVGACIWICASVIQFGLHARALRLWSSRSRLESVVKSAHNNILGDPGKFYLDHLFAYTDLAGHVVAFRAVARATSWSYSLCVMLVVTISLMLALWIIRQTRSPMIRQTRRTNPSPTFLKLNTTSDRKLIIDCKCPSCQTKTRSAWITWPLCESWYLSFQQLLQESKKWEKITPTKIIIQNSDAKVGSKTT